MAEKFHSQEERVPVAKVSPKGTGQPHEPATFDKGIDKLAALTGKKPKGHPEIEELAGQERVATTVSEERLPGNVDASPASLSAAGAETEPEAGKATEPNDDKDDSNGHGAWWWLGGGALAAAVSGLGIAFSGGDRGNSTTDTLHSNDTEVLSPKSAPVLGNYMVTLAENSGKGAPVQVVAATDPDGGPLTYAITAGNESGAFAIDPVSGAITVADPSKLDYEKVQGFSLTVQASDGSLTDTGTVTVNLIDMNDNAPIITSGTTGTIAENASTDTVIYQATASDLDTGSTITYSVKEGADASLVNIDPATGAVTLKDSADFEKRSAYTFTVIAGDGINTSEKTVTVRVTDLNDNAPVFTSGIEGSVEENSDPAAVIYQAAAIDADRDSVINYRLKPGGDADQLKIDPISGAVTLQQSPDFEKKSAYDFTVIADDGANSTEHGVRVNVIDVNDNAPVITSGARGSVAENAPTSTIIYQAAAVDADSNSTLTYSLKSGRDAELVQIDPGSGAVTLRTPGDFEAKPAYNFTVAVSDGFYSAEQEVIVAVDDVNEAPVITSNGGGTTAAVSLSENQATVTTVTATDVDAGDSKTFSISGGADGNLFAIDPLTGVLTFLAAPDREKPQDADRNNIYEVQVAVTDKGGLSDVQDLAVSVDDIREHVVVEASGAWIDLNANGIRDGEDRTRADFIPGTGNMDLSQIGGVIHYNNIPSAAIDLNGFGADDRIEIDAQAFIHNGHEGLQILTRANIQTLDAFAAPGINDAGKTDNGLAAINGGTGTSYFNHNTYTTVAAGARTAAAGLTLLDAGGALHFRSNDGPGGIQGQLAAQVPADLSLQQAVDFVNLPQRPATVHVVVDRSGAVIDTDGDGVRDSGENRLAQFDAGGSADLGGAAAVAVHFNDVPLTALDLSGFGTDDRIELDVQALKENHVLRSATRLATLTALTTATPIMAPVHVAYTFNSAVPTPAQITVRETPQYNPFAGGPANAYAVLDISHMGTAVNGKRGGALAFWGDSDNALNDARHILPGYTGKNMEEVVATLNSNAPHGGQVDFVWPVNVVVDGSGTWIDTNGDGRHDAGEATAAGLEATLASNPVTVHLNGVPDAPLDFSGFGSDDRLVIDTDALHSGKDTALSAQSANKATSWTDADGFSGGYQGTAGGDNAAVFLAGSSLDLGHSVRQTFTNSGALMTRQLYTATGPQEGTIAINAGTLGHHFDQVIFVESGAGNV